MNSKIILILSLLTVASFSTPTLADLFLQEKRDGFCFVDGKVESNHNGFSGSGFANTDNYKESAIGWSVNVPNDSSLRLKLRYANGSSTNRRADIYINGNLQATVDFYSTGSWSKWSSVNSPTIDLMGGNNRIKLVSKTTQGLPNIDYMSLPGDAPTEGSCSNNPGVSQLTIQENKGGFCAVDGKVESNHSGFSGSGFANTDNYNGSAIKWAVNVDYSSGFSLEWRYANGSSTNRFADLYVNDTKKATIDFYSTGSWSSWTSVQSPLINLSKGSNRIKLVSRTNSGLPNIDAIKLVGNGLSVGSCATSNPTPKIGSACTHSTGTVKLSSTLVVNGNFDGQCKTYLPKWGDCGQAEGQAPVIRVNGGTLKNVIVGNRGDGIHIYGNSTIENVTWPDVCEDGLTVKNEANVTIRNITASDASDKFIQLNDRATVNISKAKVNNVSQMIRENGGNCYPVEVTLTDSEISNITGQIFRSDCSHSTFKMTNTKTNNVKRICRGDGNCSVK